MLSNILSAIAGIVITATSLFTPKALPSITPTPKNAVIDDQVAIATPTPVNEYFIAEKTFNEQGKEIKIKMEISKYSTDVKGEVSGDCKGTITGSHKPQGRVIRGSALSAIELNGSINGSCLFVIPASAEFNGYYETNRGGENNFVSLEITANIFNGTYSRHITIPIVKL